MKDLKLELQTILDKRLLLEIVKDMMDFHINKNNIPYDKHYRIQFKNESRKRHLEKFINRTDKEKKLLIEESHWQHIFSYQGCYENE